LVVVDVVRVGIGDCHGFGLDLRDVGVVIFVVFAVLEVMEVAEVHLAVDV